MSKIKPVTSIGRKQTTTVYEPIKTAQTTQQLEEELQIRAPGPGAYPRASPGGVAEMFSLNCNGVTGPKTTKMVCT